MGATPNYETLRGGTRVYTHPAAPITTDSLLLAAFALQQLAGRRLAARTLADLGCGSGLLLLSLVDAGLGGAAVGLDTNAEAAALLGKAAEEQGLANVRALCQDMAGYKAPRPFDLVISNPPYYATGKRAQNPQRAAARHQGSAGIETVCAAAGRLLKDGGLFFLCWPASGLPGLFSHLQAARLAPKTLAPVRPAAQKPARLALLCAKKGGGEALTVLPDFTLSHARHDEPN